MTREAGGQRAEARKPEGGRPSSDYGRDVVLVSVLEGATLEIPIDRVWCELTVTTSERTGTVCDGTEREPEGCVDQRDAG